MFQGKFPTGRLKSRKIPSKKKKIFLILEISFIIIMIVIVTIMVLFGKTIFHQAEIHKLRKDIANFTHILSLYKYKYRYFPGDDKYAEDKFSKYKYVKNGNGTNYIGDNLKVNEELQAIRHLRAAGFLKGNPDEYPLTFPSNPFNGIYKFSYRTFKHGDDEYKVNVIIITRVPKKIAEEYDAKFDNGFLDTGLITFEPDKYGGEEETGNLIVQLEIY
jgi:hypothetical protein